MKTKVLVAALSLPLVFTACSQDEWMDDAVHNGNIKADGIKVALNVTKNYENENGAQTRAEWDENIKAIKFESGDKISVYWLGEEVAWGSAAAKTNLDVKFNSIFRTTDGASFTSEAMVFEGGNIAVFPADVNVSSQGTNKVTVKVPATQDAATIEKVPYISNQLYIHKHGNNQASQKPGYYGEGGLPSLDAPVKMAANVVDLTINLSNIPQGYDFAVQSVSLVETNGDNPFVTEAEVKTLATAPNYKGEVRYDGTTNKMATIISRAWVAPKAGKSVAELKTTALQGANTATVKARFVVLPTDATVVAGKAKIVIRTNCGTIEIDDSGKTTDTYDILKASGERTSIVAAINEFVKSQNSTTEGGKFQGENIGKNFARAINVDASTAELNGSEVYSDADIKRYISLYGAMGKIGAMQLVLSSKATSGLPTTFAGLTKAAVDQVDANDNFSLIAKNGTISKVEIVGGGEVFSIKNITNAPAGAAGSVDLVLGNGNWTMNDTFELFATGVLTNPLTRIENNGTLTIKGTVKNGNQNKVTEKIYNKGTIKLGGNNVVRFEDLETRSGSIIDIEAGQELQFANDIDPMKLYGTINVKSGAFLTVENNKTAVNNGVINNYGTIASAGSNGGLVNAVAVLDTDASKNSAGAIYVKDDAAITYVQNNAKGNIYLKNRNDEVRVESANKGNIQYNYNYAKDGATFKQYPADKFTAVLFGTDASAITLHKSVTDNLGNITDGTVRPLNTNLYFTGTTKLTSDNIKVKSLNVLSGNLQFTTGNVLTVETLKNAGTITIGGTILYSVDGGYKNQGRVLSVGGGAIEVVAGAAGTTLNAATSGNYKVSGGTNVTGVAASVVATLVADSDEDATVSNTALSAIVGNLVIGTKVTLTIGATDGTDYTFTDATPTAMDPTTLNATPSVLSAMSTKLNPSTKNISATYGKIVAYFKATLTSGSTDKVLKAEWNGTNWEIKSVNDPS